MLSFSNIYKIFYIGELAKEYKSKNITKESYGHSIYRQTHSPKLRLQNSKLMNYIKKKITRTRSNKKRVQEMHRIFKGEAFIPEWIAFTTVMNLNTQSLDRHLSFHVGEYEALPDFPERSCP